MKAGIDNSFLTLLLNPYTHASVTNASARISTLIDELSDRNATVIIPAPVLTECLVMEGTSVQETLEKLKKYSCFEIRPFDDRAAIELAVSLRGDTRAAAREARRAVVASKIQFDKQIVSIVKAQGGTSIYSDDSDLCSFARKCGLTAIALSDLPVSPIQGTLDLTTQE